MEDMITFRDLHTIASLDDVVRATAILDMQQAFKPGKS